MSSRLIDVYANVSVCSKRVERNGDRKIRNPIEVHTAILLMFFTDGELEINMLLMLL